MGLRLLNQESEDFFFVTTTFYEHRKLGNYSGVYEKLIENLEHYRTKYDARILGYVLMPSHLHFVINLDGVKVASMLRDFKKYTSGNVFRSFAKSGKLWQARYDRVAIWSEKVLRTKLNYIHENPVRAGLVQYPGDWEWSSYYEYEKDAIRKLKVWTDW